MFFYVTKYLFENYYFCFFLLKNIFFYFVFATRNRVTRNRRQARNRGICAIETWLHSLRDATVASEPRMKSKQIFWIRYLDEVPWFRKPDSSKLSQRHFLKAIFQLSVTQFFLFFF